MLDRYNELIQEKEQLKCQIKELQYQLSKQNKIIDWYEQIISKRQIIEFIEYFINSK